jgi:hypothetical protein
LKGDATEAAETAPASDESTEHPKLKSKESEIESEGEAPPDEPTGYFYTSSTSFTSGPDGFAHGLRDTFDSRTQKRQQEELRSLGGKSVLRRREVDSEGKETNSSLERKGVEESELDDFTKTWVDAQKAGFYQPPNWFPQLEEASEAEAPALTA